jgi:hypothetical protein
MEALPDFAVKPAELKNVRLAAWTSKRSGSYPNGWHLRYTVLSANFLFLYANYTVRGRLPRACYAASVAHSTSSWGALFVW